MRTDECSYYWKSETSSCLRPIADGDEDDAEPMCEEHNHRIRRRVSMALRLRDSALTALWLQENRDD